MTVLEWRKKHRRCLYCEYCRDDAWPSIYCKAKEKVVSKFLPRWLCPLYVAREIL